MNFLQLCKLVGWLLIVQSLHNRLQKSVCFGGVLNLASALALATHLTLNRWGREM
jgi:hypothetical protein